MADPAGKPTPESDHHSESAEITVDIEYARSQGVRSNDPRTFSVKLTGKEWRSLMELLEEYAVEEKHFFKLRPLVLWLKKIQKQLDGQGF